MPRRPAQTYLCQPLSELTRQLIFAPPARRAVMVGRLEQLHDQLEPDRAYPFDFLVHRITGFHAERAADTLLVGAAVQPDLRLMIDAVSQSIDLPLSGDEPADLAEDLALRLNVSTKTLTRWRALGLRWRWVTLPGAPAPAPGVPGAPGSPGFPAGRGKAAKRVAYTRSAVAHFLSRHAARVDKAARFTQLDPATRQDLLARARRLARRCDVSLHQVARHLARRAGRAVETVRLLLEQHDRTHPADPLFANHTAPLSPRQRRVIARAHRMGVAVEKIAAHFRRTPTTIYRAVRETRAAELRRIPIACITSPTFTRADADLVILRPDPLLGPAAAGEPDALPPWGHAVSAAPVDDLPEPIRPLYRQPVIAPDHQLRLLVRMNYLRFKAAAAQAKLDPYDPRAADLDLLASCLHQVAAIRRLLVGANLPAVLQAARRQLIGESDRSQRRLLELLETGNQVLIEVIDTFDFNKDMAFESFLTWTLMRRFAAGNATAAGPTADAATARAHRRERPEESLHRLIDKAGESGVDLKLDPE